MKKKRKPRDLKLKNDYLLASIKISPYGMRTHVFTTSDDVMLFDDCTSKLLGEWLIRAAEWIKEQEK